MKLAIGSDHAAYLRKAELSDLLRSWGHEVLDLGTHSEESCDYPDFAHAVAVAVTEGAADRGVLICGTGLGMSMAANHHPGIRAALCTSPELARLSREHNDANIICMGARTQTLEEMETILQIWFDTPFEGNRHQRRVRKIDRILPEE